MPYRFELATPADDADLRHILSATPMGGTVSLAFAREPSFFAAEAVEGQVRQVVAARDVHAGRLVGFGCRCLRNLHVNGKPRQIGYLSTLRLLPEHRNRGLVARGYAFFRALHRDGLAPFYLTTIADGNEQALGLLTSGRAGLPTYHFAGEYHTLAIPPRHSSVKRRNTIEVRRATVGDLSHLADFLNCEGSRRQFFPRVESADFAAGGLFHGLRLEQIWLAERNGELVGTLGAWDQSAYRQTIVQGFRGPIRWLRPAYNAWAWCRGLPRLPRPGQPFAYITGAIPVIKGDDQEVLASLIDAAARGDRHLLLGLHIEDPLLPTARRLAAAVYITRLYIVCWNDGEAVRQALDERVPYLELGTL